MNKAIRNPAIQKQIPNPRGILVKKISLIFLSRSVKTLLGQQC